MDLVVTPIFTPALDPHLAAELLYDEPLVVVAGATAAWSRRRRLKLADLMEATWTLPPPESLYGGVVAEAFRNEGLEVPHATVFTSVTAVRYALLATGRFLSIVQGSVVRFNFLAPQFKVLPVALPTTRRPIAAITLKGRTLIPSARLFIDCARKIARQSPRRAFGPGVSWGHSRRARLPTSAKCCLYMITSFLSEVVGEEWSGWQTSPWRRRAGAKSRHQLIFGAVCGERRHVSKHALFRSSSPRGVAC